jgi:hypothetical protein
MAIDRPPRIGVGGDRTNLPRWPVAAPENLLNLER